MEESPFADDVKRAAFVTGSKKAFLCHFIIRACVLVLLCALIWSKLGSQTFSWVHFIARYLTGNTMVDCVLGPSLLHHIDDDGADNNTA